jgi:hypothetical protein
LAKSRVLRRWRGRWRNKAIAPDNLTQISSTR